MALQDLTPQLRTRLNRMEKAVGLFVSIATLTLLALLVYYIYHLAGARGWFLTKVHYSTGVKDATGLEVGTPVKLLGRTVGEVTKVELNNPGDYYNLTVQFDLREPYYGYVWTDSKVQVASDMLGHRWIQIVPGVNGAPTVAGKGRLELRLLDRGVYNNEFKAILSDLSRQATNQSAANSNVPIHIDDAAVRMQARQKAHQEAKSDLPRFYPFAPSGTNVYFILPDETPDIMGRLEQVASTVEKALPGILNLTNLVAGALTNAMNLEVHLTGLIDDTRPAVSNLSLITGNLKNPQGSLGTWLIPPATLGQLDDTLESAHRTMADTDTNLNTVISNINLSLESLASITSNLNAQVQANTNMLSSITKIVVDSDTFVQGLKHHWLLRSAFKPAKTNSASHKR